MRNVVFIGATGIAKIVMEIVQSKGLPRKYNFVGIVDDNERLKGETIYKLTVLGTFEDMDDIILCRGITHAVICIPENYMNVRKNYFNKCKKSGLQMLSAVHSKAVISKDVILGEGVIVMAGVIINAGAKIGNNVIIFSNATVEHDCILEDNVYISPGVQLGGHVVIKESAMLGIGSVVLPKRMIGEGGVVGAGAVVIDDVREGSVVVGIPAREMQQ